MKEYEQGGKRRKYIYNKGVGEKRKGGREREKKRSKKERERKS